MVVAKDENMASSFEAGLSDLDSVWYKQKYQIEATEETYSNEENPVVTSQAYRAASNTCVYQERTNVPPEIATFKKFTLDCENLVDYGAGFLFCGGVDNDFYDSRGEGRAEVGYNIISYDAELTPLTVYDAGIDFNVLLPLGTTWQGGSGVFPGEFAQVATPTVDQCNGNFPPGALELIQSGQVVQWTSSGIGTNGNTGGAVCTFVLEPCEDEACSAY